MAKKPIYRNLAALEPVQRLVDEAGKTIADPTRHIDTDGLSEIAAALGGGVAGAAIGVGAVSVAGTVAGLSGPGIMSGLAALGGLVGAGAAVGIAVAAAPVGILAVGGYAVVKRVNSNRLMEAKQALYQEAIAKQQAVLRALESKGLADSQRIETLTFLNHQLQGVILNLRQDLAEA